MRFHEGQKVVYRAPHVAHDEPGEEGVVVKDGINYVHVRYGNDTHAKATPKACVTPVAAVLGGTE